MFYVTMLSARLNNAYLWNVMTLFSTHWKQSGTAMAVLEQTTEQKQTTTTNLVKTYSTHRCSSYYF